MHKCTFAALLVLLVIKIFKKSLQSWCREPIVRALAEQAVLNSGLKSLFSEACKNSMKLSVYKKN
jgi:hypothetical protein